MGAKKPLGDGEKMISELRDEHQAMIKRLQPYKRIGRGHERRWGFGLARSHPLWLLHEINIADKHRVSQVAGIKPGAFSWGGWGNEVEEPLFTRRIKVLKDSAKFGEFSANVVVQPDIIPLIAFFEGCDAVKGATVHLALRLMLEQVSEIVESFGPEFE